MLKIKAHDPLPGIARGFALEDQRAKDPLNSTELNSMIFHWLETTVIRLLESAQEHRKERHSRS